MSRPEAFPDHIGGIRRTTAAAPAAVVAGLRTLVPAISGATDFDALAKLYSAGPVQQHVINAAARSTVILNPCPDAQYGVLKIFSVIRPFTLDENGQITSGVWGQAVRELRLRR